MAFAMIGANIFSAVATIREESIRIIRRYSKCGSSCCCLRNYSVNNSNSNIFNIAFEGILFQLLNHTSSCKGINSNPGSSGFHAIWRARSTITKSRKFRTEKWQVQILRKKCNLPLYSPYLTNIYHRLNYHDVL